MDPGNPAPKPKPKPNPSPKPTQTDPSTPAPPKHTSVATTSLPQPAATSPTLQPSPTAQPDTAKAGLATPAIAGIAGAGALIVLFVLSIILCKKRRARAYANREHVYDPSRDPIDPNDVLPLESKFDQRTSPPPHNDSGIVSYPMALRSAPPAAQDTKNDSLISDQDPHTRQQQQRHQQPQQQQQQRHQQQRQQQDYQQYDEHIQSHFGPESPDLMHRGLMAAGGSGNRAHFPTPISTNSSLDGPRSPPHMSPSQRAQLQHQQQGPLSPRSPRSQPLQQQQQQQPLADTSAIQDAVIVSDMGNQFVLQSSNNSVSGGHGHNMERGRDSFDQDGSVVQSELSYRRPPRKSQDSNPGGIGHPLSSQPSTPLYNGAGLASPNGPGGSQQRGGRSMPNSGSGGQSPYSSPHQGPSHPSPRAQHAQYQPPQPYSQQQQQQPYPQQSYPKQPYPQHSSQARPMLGPGSSPPVHPQQRPAYPGGGQARSPPMGPRGPGYPQSSSNYRPITNNS